MMAALAALVAVLDRRADCGADRSRHIFFMCFLIMCFFMVGFSMFLLCPLAPACELLAVAALAGAAA